MMLKKSVAGNQSTPPETLAELSENPNEMIKERVANNTSTPSRDISKIKQRP